MFLRDLRISNLRCVKDLHISFESNDQSTRKWTLILGENGCGKSTVLRAAAILLAGSDALPHLLGREIDSWIHYGEDEAKVDATLVNVDGETRNVSLRIRRGTNISRLFELNKSSLNELDAAIAHADRNYLAMGYGASRRLSTATDSAFHGRSNTPLRARSVLTLFFPEAVLAPLEAWVIDMDYRGSKMQGQQLMELVEDLMPEVRFHGIDKDQKRLMFDTPDGLTPLSQLSDGYQNVAAWCGDLLKSITEAFVNYKDPLKARGLLLIDEIDLHLHPVWQRLLREYLDRSFPNLQFVATTHSPLTVQQSGEGELHVMGRDNPKASPTVRPFEGAPNTMMLHQLLVSPIFNLNSMDSLKVQEKRNEFRRLKSKGKRSAQESKQFKTLKSSLETLPDLTEGLNKYKQEQTEVLKDIRQALEGSRKRKSVAGSSKPATDTIDAVRPRKHEIKLQDKSRPTKKKLRKNATVKKARRKGK